MYSKLEPIFWYSNLEPFFGCTIVVLRLLRLNTKARHNIPEFLTANLLSEYVVALDIDWSLNILHNFLLNAHLVAHQPHKSEN